MSKAELSMALEMLENLSQKKVEAGQLLVTLSLFDLLATMSMLNARFEKARASGVRRVERSYPGACGREGRPEGDVRGKDRRDERDGRHDRYEGYERDKREERDKRDEREERDERDVKERGEIQKQAGAREGIGERNDERVPARKSLDWRRQWKQSAG
ncbi:MAG TPA: hypothetical protein GXX51_04060 [Firmicutes bacterium]|nr:hypothetical protein [Bacillota bacterium]